MNQSDSARLSASLASKVKDEYSWGRNTMWKYMFDQNEGLIYLVWRIFVGSNAYWWPRYVSESKTTDDNRYFVCGECSVSVAGILYTQTKWRPAIMYY